MSNQSSLPALRQIDDAPRPLATAVPIVTDAEGNIFPVDPEGKKDCTVLYIGHLSKQHVNASYCYTVDERRQMIRDMVYVLVEALERSKIVYWVDSGTLLGAHRDQDLISFDLDADIGLTQASFESLRHTKIDVPDRYELFINDSPIYAPGPYWYLPGRFVDKMTGLYTDIFEFLPDSRLMPVNTTTVLEVRAGSSASLEKNGFVMQVDAKADHNATVFVTLHTVEDKLTDVLAPVASGCWWACKNCPEKQHFIVPVDWIFPLQRCTFGEKKVYCPAKIHEYLTMLYGEDYMTPQII
ncbi:hypothetical protein ACHHYP_02389 [Achlya hypogyna]|uniref:LicD/FKTN/FKRP nucleotidyltransferase domain-containing protein n=1 Tax=Achlya hypogyna TaxID=1202772 RepID=A0A1V9Z6N6_ACHHY|nr:hypothetical protein ACHHYP_02389 [Achlya hypogyna]